MTGQRYVSAWDQGLRHLGGHWIKDGLGLRATEEDTLNHLMKPDHVILVDVDGMVHDDVDGVCAPEVQCGSGPDGSIFGTHERDMSDHLKRQGWAVEWGWSGQNSGRDNGPIMHTSEFIGGNLAEHIIGTPGLWVVCDLNMERMDCPDDVKGCDLHNPCPSCEDGRETEPAGWLVMHHPAHVERTDLLGRITCGVVMANAGVSFTVAWEDGATTTERYDAKGKTWREAGE